MPKVTDSNRSQWPRLTRLYPRHSESPSFYAVFCTPLLGSVVCVGHKLLPGLHLAPLHFYRRSVEHFVLESQKAVSVC